jgi:hypothetical protein
MLKQEIENGQTRVLVILLRDATLPGLLASKEYVDARENREAALSKVVERLEGLTRLGKQVGGRAVTFLVDEYRQDFVGPRHPP